MIAISDFEGVPKVGCGQSQQEAIVDLFKNAMPDKTMKWSPPAAMQMAHLDRIKKEGNA
jgi:lysine/ornithine N-monooxygenase